MYASPCADTRADTLTSTQDVRGLTPFARLQLRAYTIWNLAFLGVRVALNQAQWDSFLAVNSLGIACGFRTAMCQGIGENMRRKLAAQLAHDGLDLPRWQVQQRHPLRLCTPPRLCTSVRLRLCACAVLHRRPCDPHAAAPRAPHRPRAPCGARAPHGAQCCSAVRPARTTHDSRTS